MFSFSAYRVKSKKAVCFIPISQIEFTTPMYERLKLLNIDDNYKKYHKTRYDNIIIRDRSQTFGLSRIENMIRAIQNNRELPPVKLSIQKSKIIQYNQEGPYIIPPLRNREDVKTQPTLEKREVESITYSVHNGRHRVVACLFLGFTHIPAIISD